MGYDYYGESRDKLFTDEGQRVFLQVRDKAKHLLKIAGAFREEEVLTGIANVDSSWQLLACVDRMIELGEILECKNPRSSAEQHRVFVNGERL